MDQTTLNVLFDLRPKRASLDGELDPNSHDVSTVTRLERHVAGHSQIDNVVAQFGVHHRTQHGPDVIDVGCRGQAHAISVRALYDFMSKHPADSGLYVPVRLTRRNNP